MHSFTLMKTLPISACLFLGTMLNNAAAENIDWNSFKYDISVKSNNDKGPLEDKQLYAIDVTCKVKGPSSPRSNLFDTYLRRVTASHIVILTQKNIVDTPSLTNLPTDALMVMHPYSTAKDSSYRDGDCTSPSRKTITKTQVIVGGPDVHLVAAGNFTVTNDLGPVTNLITGVLNVVSPLAALFGGGPVAASINTYVTQSETVTKPFQSLLTQLNQNKTTGKSLTLRNATYVIEAPYSIEIITVRPVSSVVQMGGYQFTKFLTEQLAKITTTLTAANASTSCASIYTDLGNSGFRSPVDKGYAMLQLSLKASFQKDQIIDCLPYEEAIAVSKLSDRYWTNANPLTQRFKTDDVEIRKGGTPSSAITQPTYDRPLVSQLYETVSSLSTAGKTNLLTAEDDSRLSKNFSFPIQIVDNTNQRQLGNHDIANASELFSVFSKAGLTRFGCYSPTTATALDATGDGAVAAFLGFKISQSADTATQQDAFVFRPFWDKKGIRKLAVLRDVGMIDSILTTAHNTCGELRITAAKQPIS